MVLSRAQSGGDRWSLPDRAEVQRELNRPLFRRRTGDLMARCDEGYLCEVCGEPVDGIDQSDLYLRYVMGLVSESDLPNAPERHILCNPVQAQFIVHDDFPPVTVEGAFSKRELDAEFVRQQEALTTRGWQRLREVTHLGLPVAEYPLSVEERRRLTDGGG